MMATITATTEFDDNFPMLVKTSRRTDPSHFVAAGASGAARDCLQPLPLVAHAVLEAGVAAESFSSAAPRVKSAHVRSTSPGCMGWRLTFGWLADDARDSVDHFAEGDRM